MIHSKKKNWLFAIVLSTPTILFFLSYLLNHSLELIPTGFRQYDNVSYIAFAKQYLDFDKLSLLYSNPFNDSNNYKAIYFQPQTLFFALLLKLDISPGHILIPFTLVCSILCFRILISLYDFIAPDSKFRTLNIWLFSWGGGLLFYSGVLVQTFYRINSVTFLDNGFILDPEWGWWGLNFGRSLFFSCEAYYHLLFFGCIYSVIHQKFKQSLVLLFMLSVSHPFTGIELITIVCLWSFIELFFYKRVPVWFMLGSIFILLFHIWYYLIFLNSFPDHASVSQQYSLKWRLRFFTMPPAYGIVGTLAVLSIWKTSIKIYLKSPYKRLFLCWFIAAFTLANHELFIAAKQPIHFSRGYIWTSLFLLGVTGLRWAEDYIVNRLRLAGLILFSIVFLSDNFFWILNNIYSKATQPSDIYITREQSNLLHFLNKKTNTQTLIVSQDGTISYLSSIYTKAYPWFSHPFTTPFAQYKKESLDAFFQHGKIDKNWIGRKVVFITREPNNVIDRISINERFKSQNYFIGITDSLYKLY